MNCNSAQSQTVSKSYSGYIDGKFAWEIPFWMYHNPFSDSSRQLRRAMDTMRVYLNDKDDQEHKNKLTDSIE
jgi:hypothetical protein